jgi:HNH endonuclease/AP2 domain
MRKSSIILVHGDLAVVRLIGRHSRGEHALIDAADVPLVEWINWTVVIPASAQHKAIPYVTGHVEKRGKSVYVHGRIMNVQPGEFVDHLDHNTLDCRRDNLRVCSKSQNAMNMKKRRGCSSIYKGVSFEKKCGAWSANITLDYQQRYLGIFATEIEAAHAYDLAALELFGEFASLNYPASPIREAA